MNYQLKTILAALAAATSIFSFSEFALAEVFNIALYKEAAGKIRFDHQANQPLRLINNAKPMNFDGDYTARVVSFLDAILEKTNFQPLEIVAGDKFNPKTNLYEGGMKVSETGAFPFILQLPYYANAQYAEIFDPEGNKQLKIYLTAFARCNENKICEPGEDEKDCPSDCQPKPPLTTFGKFWRIGITVLYWLGILALITFLAIKIKNRVKKQKNA